MNVLRELLLPLAPLYFLAKDMKDYAVAGILGERIAAYDGAAPESSCYAVVVIYQKHRLLANTLRMLKALRRAGVAIVAVVNGKPQPILVDQLRDVAWKVFVRRNFGRDFGGYKFGVDWLLRRTSPERMLLMNDSVFYRSAGLDSFVAALMDDRHAFVGATENHEFSYHVGSFALGLSGDVVAHTMFRRYWRRYNPTSNRKTVIAKGEMGLTRLVADRIGVRPSVLFSIPRIEARLRTLSLQELMELYPRMPTWLDKVVQADVNIDERVARLADGWSLSLGQLVDGAGALSKLSLEGEGLDRIDRAKRMALFLDESENVAVARVRDRFKDSIVREIIDLINRGSQIHLGGPLWARYLEAPLLKNDLVMRNFYRTQDLRVAFADELSEEEFDEFYYLQMRKGFPEFHWRGLRKLMYDIFFEYF